MKIYISGITGTGMGPLALMATEAGMEVCGSDLQSGAVLSELKAKKIPVSIGAQDGKFLDECIKKSGVDWFVYTSALPPDHPELTKAVKYGIKVSKRDELIAYLVEKLRLKMVAIAGTHGKTTTTAMLIWACQRLGLPVSYLVGTVLPFAPAGNYHPGAKYFIYEADEYDRNFLKFHPWLSVITNVSYDHPDTYPRIEDYQAAFRQFTEQSGQVITPEDASLPLSGGASTHKIPTPYLETLTLSGAARRLDAALALLALQKMAPDVPTAQIAAALNEFPGGFRRFERIIDGVYTDYAHHPEEVQATVQAALEEAARLQMRGAVVVYQPHQNTRQHSVRQGYKRAFTGVSHLFWLPTFLTREDPNLPILSPAELLGGLENPKVGSVAEMNDRLVAELVRAHREGFLVILMTAGPADGWFRQIWQNNPDSTTNPPNTPVLPR